MPLQLYMQCQSRSREEFERAIAFWSSMTLAAKQGQEQILFYTHSDEVTSASTFRRDSVSMAQQIGSRRFKSSDFALAVSTGRFRVDTLMIRSSARDLCYSSCGCTCSFARLPFVVGKSKRMA